MKTTRYQLEVLTCPTCISKIEGVLSKENGVNGVKVLFNSSKVKVDYNEALVSSAHIGELIERLGYPILSVK